MVLTTVVINPTLNIYTCHQGVALESDRTYTACLVEFNNTFSSSSTRSVCVEARIETVLIDAGLVHRTIIVSSTLGPVALSVRITSISLWTRAHWVVGTCGTRGLWGARVVDNTRVNAVLIDTSLVLRTVRILGTLGSWLDRITICKWIPSEPRRTVASDTVGSDVTNCVLGTRVGHNAGVETGPVSADLLVSTVTVRAAARWRWWWKIAGNIRIPHVSGDAHTDHGTLGKSVLDRALRVLSARRQN